MKKTFYPKRSKKIKASRSIRCYREDLDDIDFDTWFELQGADDGSEFIFELEELVRSKYDVDEFEEEPSIQGYQGGDDILITLSDGNIYSFSFDYNEELQEIYSEGPEDAARTYFDIIVDGIESGSAKIED